MNSNLRIKDFKDMTDEWLDFIIDCRSGKPHDYDIVIGQWQMIRFIIMYPIIWKGLLPENNSGYWQNLNIQHIRLIFVQMRH